MAVIIAASALIQGAQSAAGAESPLHGMTLPVPVTDVTDTDTDLADTRNEVLVLTRGDHGPEVRKLRARSEADAERLTSSLSKLPGVTASRNRSYTLPDPIADARAVGGAPIDRPQVEASATGGTPRPLQIADEDRGGEQWGLYAIGAESAWPVTRGAGVTVAVIDTGVDSKHPDLAGRLKPQVNVVPGPNGDVNGHGTHVAGIIAASMDGKGVVGLASKASILPIRVFASESTDSGSVASGIYTAISGRVQVINLSLGGPEEDDSAVLARAVADAVSAGITVVASGGNAFEWGNPVNFPSAYPGVLGVSSVDRQLNHSPFANAGTYIDIAAPGQDVLSTYPGGGYATKSGTSMAAPFVSAAAALVRSANPTLSGPQVSSVLLSTAEDDRSGDGRDSVFGYGMLRADLATAEAARLPGGVQGAKHVVSAYAARAGYGNVLAVNVNPDRSDGRRYVLGLQKRAANGTWVALPKKYRTNGPTETRSITLSAGVYRAIVLASAGYTDAISTPVTITARTVKVAVGRDAALSKLVVNVNPDRGKGHWTFKVQQRNPSGTWTTQRKRYKTKGAAETRRIDLRSGTYRVVVVGKHGFLGSVSAPVTLVR